MSRLDLTKPMRCKGGSPVVIYTTKHPGHYPIVGYIEGNSTVYMWTLEGVCRDAPRRCDLENVPQETRYGYLNVYSDYRAGSLYESREKADEEQIADDRIACLRIKLEKRFDD